MQSPIQQAVEAVRLASRAAEAVRGALSITDLQTKQDHSPVTVADLAAQAVAAACLGREIPLTAEEDAGLLAENPLLLQRVTAVVGAVLPGASETDVQEWVSWGGAEPADLFWTLDPIDGTKGYLRGGQYAVALALIENGAPVLGVLGCPALDGGVIAFAEKGSGAWVVSTAGQEAVRVYVSQQPDPKRWRSTGPVERGHAGLEAAEEILSDMGVESAPIAVDSQCKYLLVAQGAADLYLRMPRDTTYRENIWDHAAGAILVQEAGGIVTDIHGRELDFGTGRRLMRNIGTAAGSPAAHRAAVRAISNRMPSLPGNAAEKS
jgi:3'(2'), 5'-bisphosphate nucleotidase